MQNLCYLGNKIKQSCLTTNNFFGHIYLDALRKMNKYNQIIKIFIGD